MHRRFLKETMIKRVVGKNLVNPVQSKKSISVSDEDVARGYRLESVNISKAGAA